MDTQNSHFTWVEPKLVIRKSLNDQTSYLLYNRISNFNINNDNYKIVSIEVPKYKSNYSQYITDYRLEYAKYLKNLYPESYTTDSGFSAMIDAIKSFNDHVIFLYKNFILVGVVSYEILDKKKTITISHIGVLERRKGYGSVLMTEIFSLVKLLHYKVLATSNGYADDFYHYCGMIRIVDKPLGIYYMDPVYIKDIQKLSYMIHSEREI
jgi:hypothetical protein